MSETIYLNCRAKARSTQFGEIINVSMKVEDLIAFANEHKNQGGYLNLSVRKRKQEGRFGETHSIVLDTWEPRRREGGGETEPW